jgi:hypothetical protein
MMARRTYSELMYGKASQAGSDADRQRYVSLAERGYPYPREELRQRMEDASDVDERRFYEELWSEQFGAKALCAKYHLKPTARNLVDVRKMLGENHTAST